MRRPAPAAPPPSKPLTGRRVALMFIGFFAVVIAVNIGMARLALTGFSGTTVANSYVASQNFNRWLAEGRRQAAVGWQVAARLEANRMRLTVTDAGGQPLTGAAIVASARPPLGDQAAVRLAFRPDGAGTYVSTSALPPAPRWRVDVTVAAAGSRVQQRLDLP